MFYLQSSVHDGADSPPEADVPLDKTGRNLRGGSKPGRLKSRKQAKTQYFLMSVKGIVAPL